MTKKSKAQIKRMMKRAAARGEEYVPPEADETKEQQSATDDEDTRKIQVARRLRMELQEIESNEAMKSKERRSAKRKAEAIASEEVGIPADELLEWPESQKPDDATAGAQNNEAAEAGANETDQAEEGETRKRQNPYIVFVGKLSFTTTQDVLFRHIQRELAKEHTINDETVQIRLLTNPKTKKSRGMAFVETSDPELLYALLKLHHTALDGRRINVERTVGGKRNSDARKSKLDQLRKEQAEHMSEVVDKLLEDHLSSGELQEKELDDAVIGLCKRHSAATVEASLVEYLETNGRDKDNPSAYLTHILGRIAEEGIEEQIAKRERRERRAFDRSKAAPYHGGDRPAKRARAQSAPKQTDIGVVGNKLEDFSDLAKAGVDMSLSFSGPPGENLAKIFPSMRRGRGRGYM